MRLTFSKDSTANSIVTDEAGQTIYIFRTLRNVGTRTTTIYRASTAIGAPPSINTRSETNEEEEWHEPGQPLMRFFGQIVHNTFSPVLFKFADSTQVTSKEFFKNDGAFWKQKKIWKGPDGKDYVWHYGEKSTHLNLADDESTRVAEFHNPLLANPRGLRVYLDVYPPGEHMVDQIVFTLAYIQRLKRSDNREF